MRQLQISYTGFKGKCHRLDFCWPWGRFISHALPPICGLSSVIVHLNSHWSSHSLGRPHARSPAIFPLNDPFSKWIVLSACQLVSKPMKIKHCNWILNYVNENGVRLWFSKLTSFTLSIRYPNAVTVIHKWMDFPYSWKQIPDFAHIHSTSNQLVSVISSLEITNAIAILSLEWKRKLWCIWYLVCLVHNEYIIYGWLTAIFHQLCIRIKLQSRKISKNAQN